MRWVITGGCGFIGTSIARAFARAGDHAIRVVDNLSVGSKEDLGAVVAFAEVAPEHLTSMSSLAPGAVELVVGDLRHEIEAYENFFEFRAQKKPDTDALEKRREILQLRRRRRRRRDGESLRNRGGRRSRGGGQRC